MEPDGPQEKGNSTTGEPLLRRPFSKYLPAESPDGTTRRASQQNKKHSLEGNGEGNPTYALAADPGPNPIKVSRFPLPLTLLYDTMANSTSARSI